MSKKLKNWFDKGDGGNFYEPYVTNKDVLFIYALTLIVCGIMILGCYLINLYN